MNLDKYVFEAIKVIEKEGKNHPIYAYIGTITSFLKCKENSPFYESVYLKHPEVWEIDEYFDKDKIEKSLENLFYNGYIYRRTNKKGKTLYRIAKDYVIDKPKVVEKNFYENCNYFEKQTVDTFKKLFTELFPRYKQFNTKYEYTVSFDNDPFNAICKITKGYDDNKLELLKLDFKDNSNIYISYNISNKEEVENVINLLKDEYQNKLNKLQSLISDLYYKISSYMNQKTDVCKRYNDFMENYNEVKEHIIEGHDEYYENTYKSLKDEKEKIEKGIIYLISIYKKYKDRCSQNCFDYEDDLIEAINFEIN